MSGRSLRSPAALGLLAAAMLAVALLAAGCAGTAEDVPAGELTQRDEGGGVVITATLVTPDHLAAMGGPEADEVDLGRETAVHLQFETHQGDLRGYDFQEGARLLPGAGGDRAPVRWTVTRDDAHHLEGLLVFDGVTDGDGVGLALRDLGGVPERFFRWDGTS